MSAERITSIIHILEEMDSSSSSSGDDDYLHVLGTVLEFCDMESHAKIRDYVDNVVSVYSDNDFKKHFRLYRCTCSGLTQMFQESNFCPASQRDQGGGSKMFPAEDYILVFLYFAGNKASYRQVGDIFGIAESTVLKIINVVMEFLVDNASLFICFPETTAAKQASAAEFLQLAGFPNCIGCLDGSYIITNKPVGKIRSTYINRHDQVSITLQGICDAKKKFIDVFTGPPSRIHDSRIFQMSPIANRLENICENRFHILADAAYELKEWVLTPFRNYELLSLARQRYNNRLCTTRVVIENAYGMLKRRFLQLLHLYLWDVDRITKFIISCCVLHNICIDANDDMPLDEDDDNNDDIENDGGNNDVQDHDFFDSRMRRLLRQRGEIKRNGICVAMQ